MNPQEGGFADKARSFEAFFRDATGLDHPYQWQIRVAVEGIPEVLPIPTGLGKTEGTVLVWAWRRLRDGAQEPLHLIYCLPMRTLVRQTVERLRRYFGALTDKRGLGPVRVYRLMGGAVEDEWAGKPDEPWVLVGTQDQLLSRALNRGYSMNRFEWPMHFGLLNHDCHWIVDEVQLMGPGLFTTSQLDWMRRRRFPALKPNRTTWMSATMGQSFLATADRQRDGFDNTGLFDPRLDEDDNEEMQRRRAARRPVVWFKLLTGKRAGSLCQQIASRASAEHTAGTLSLIVCNTVGEAQEIFKALPRGAPKILLTSRFRPGDRLAYEKCLLEFEVLRSAAEDGVVPDHPGLICVSTQVVEAGLDISAHHLWSELAPWASVIQRLGRLNRDGRDNAGARAHFWPAPKLGEKKSDGDIFVGPYPKSALDKAKTLMDAFAPLSLERSFAEATEKLQERCHNLLDQVLEPSLTPLPRALDVHGLFSTERDLHGGFTDVSPFVRDSDPDADLTVFWRTWPGVRPPRGEMLDGPPFDPAEGCEVPFYGLSEFLKDNRAKAWIWDDEDEGWEACALDELRPGMLVMLHRDVGGYDSATGWTGDPQEVLQEAPPAGPRRGLRDDERSEAERYVALDVHLRDARAEAERICAELGLEGLIRAAVVEAASIHDIGKAHPKWQTALPGRDSVSSGPWAKCPRVLAVDLPRADPAVSYAVARLLPGAVALPDSSRRDGIRLRWIVEQKLAPSELGELKKVKGVRWAGYAGFRPGMRHEAASALAAWKRYRDSEASYPALAVYLIAAHHGKVRTVLRATTPDAGDVFGVPAESSPLAVDGTEWPLDFSVAADGAAGEWRENEFILSDYGWTGIVADLLGPWRDRKEDSSDVGAVPEHEPRRLGPFVLAWLEALVRVADWRASDRPSEKFTAREVLLDR